MTKATPTRKSARGLPLRLKFIQAWVDQDGRAHHYFRRAGYPRVPLPGLPGSLEFMSAYQAALDSAMTPIGADKRSKPGSVSAAIASYYASQSFRSLAASSQIVRKAVLEAFRRDHGDLQIAAMPRKFIAALLDAMTPTTARNWFKAIRALTDHCIKVGMLKDDPTLGIRPRPIKGDGFHTWTEDEIAAFEAKHAIGTRERLALALGLYSGQRRDAGDPRAPRAAGGARSRTSRPAHVPDDGARQAVRRPGLHDVVRQGVRQGGPGSAVYVSRLAQGRMPTPRRGGLHRASDRGDQRTREPQGSRALHQGRRPSPAGASGNGKDGGSEEGGSVIRRYDA